MQSHHISSRPLAIGLAMLAGFIDALGFRSLGGFFVSFMSGNSTRFAVGIVDHAQFSQTWLPLAVIGLFVVGVMAGRLMRHVFSDQPAAGVLALMSVTLIAAALLAEAEVALLPASLMVIAMGAANNVFVREGEVSIAVTYMTGTLVKFGQRLAGRLLGETESDWLSYFLLWLGLIGGAIGGALAYDWMGLSALWIAALCAALFFVTLIDKTEIKF